jgi:hypothetical protein
MRSRPAPPVGRLDAFSRPSVPSACHPRINRASCEKQSSVGGGIAIPGGWGGDRRCARACRYPVPSPVLSRLPSLKFGGLRAGMHALHSARRGETSLAGPNRSLGSARVRSQRLRHGPSRCGARSFWMRRETGAATTGPSSRPPVGLPARSLLVNRPHSRQRRFFFVCRRCPSPCDNREPQRAVPGALLPQVSRVGASSARHTCSWR